MKTGYTHISIILDRSGSMESVKADTIGGFNAFLTEQQTAPGTATLTLSQFDNEYEVLANFAPIATVRSLTERTFVPRGSTALLDAIGRNIIDTGARLAALPEAERPAHVIVAIMTDGEENASREFDRSKIFAMISEQTAKYAWEFVFIGANQDAIAAGASMGISRGNSIAYAASPAGTQDIMSKLSKNASRRRAAATEDVDIPAFLRRTKTDSFFTEEDRATRPDLPESKS